MDYWRWISTALGSLLLWVALFFLKRYFPARRIQETNQQEMLSEKEYQVAQFGFLLLFFLCIFLVGSIFLHAYDWSLSIRNQALPAEAALILPDPWAWYVGIGFLALGCGGLLSYFLMKAFLGERNTLYIEESSRRSGIDTRKIFFPLYIGIMVLAGLLLVPLSNTYLRIETDRVIMNSFWGRQETTYPISSVQGVKYSNWFKNKQGKLVLKPRYIVEFKGGERWTTTKFPYGIEDPAPYQPAFEQLATRAGLNIELVDP